MNKFHILFSLLVVGLLVDRGNSAKYGQRCHNSNSSVPAEYCDSGDPANPIKCSKETATPGDPGTCQCWENMIMVKKQVTANNTTYQCVSPHGQICTVSSGDGNYIQECAEFAECWPKVGDPASPLARVNGTCYCDQDAVFMDSTQLCKLTHGSPRCKKNTDCNTVKQLICSEGVCTCQSDEFHAWGGEEAGCLVLAGGACNPSGPFLPKCLGDGTSTNCTQGLCTCMADLTETPDHRCGKQFGASCNEKTECHPQFDCLEKEGGGDGEKTCACPAGQHYHELDQQCRLHTGQTCNATSGPQCTLHAVCINEKCECSQGYKSGANQTCFAELSSSCTDVPCYEDDYLRCSEAEKVCECNDKYEAVGMKCVGWINESCKDTPDCINNTVCSTNNKCGCGERQEEAEDLRSCLALYNAPCSESTKCSPGRHLGCVNSVCQCANPEMQLYYQEQDRCVAKAGAECGDIDCVVDSSCTSGVCNCNPSFVGNNDGICVKQGPSGSISVAPAGIIVFVALMFSWNSS